MNKIIIVIFVLLICGLWFYWFQYRPTEIRKICAEKKIAYIASNDFSSDTYTKKNADYVYDTCISAMGLEN